MIYLRLFWEFFKTGLFSIGGGMATLPFLQSMADTTGWFTRGQLADMVAVAESTPGAMGMNMATYVGYTVAGPLGSIVATVALACPSIIIIIIIAALLKSFRDNKYVNSAFYGLRPASTGLITAAGVSIALICLFNTEAFAASQNIADLITIRAIILFIVLWLCTNAIKPLKKLHPIWFILASALIGIIFKFADA